MSPLDLPQKSEEESDGEERGCEIWTEIEMRIDVTVTGEGQLVLFFFLGFLPEQSKLLCWFDFWNEMSVKICAFYVMACIIR